MSKKWDLRKRVNKYVDDIEDNAELIMEFCKDGPHYINMKTLQNTAKEMNMINIENEIAACRSSITIIERLIKVLHAEDRRQKTTNQLDQAEFHQKRIKQ